MKIETALPANEPLRNVGGIARRLEELGFDTLLTYEGAHDPFLPVAQAAQMTQRVELATGVAIAFARNPMLCAQIANDLQEVANGRFILGLGVQTQEHIERRFSQEWSRPADRMGEFIRAIRAIWTCWEGSGELDFRGEFYTHTLMVPMFNPGPNPYGKPKIFLGAVGPRMLEVAGAEADGVFITPFNTREYVLSSVLPSVQRGLKEAGRTRPDIEICCQTIVMIGETDAELAAARGHGRSQLAFHLTLPAYTAVIELNGWEGVVAEARRLQSQHRWEDIEKLVTEDMLDRVGVSGTPKDVGRRLRTRNDFADRTAIVIYNGGEDGAVGDLLSAFHAEGAKHRPVGAEQSQWR